MEKYAVLMAGGAGSRLWPLSREKKPKQFIDADGNQCMMLRTIERIGPAVPPENCYVVTNCDLAAMTETALKDVVPASNLILEPQRKNTAACIAYSVFSLKSKGKDGALCFFPADGYVRDQPAYRLAVGQAFEAAEHSEGLVVIGIAPGYPATGYGYLHVEPGLKNEVSPVIRFVEKPDRETAEKFLASGDYLWNSGIVAGKFSAFVSHIRSFLPEHYEKFSAFANGLDGQDISLTAKKAYEGLPDISFDKGVLEKSGDIAAVRGNFDWDDIGSLESLAISLSPDGDGNRVKGEFFGVGAKNCIVYGDKSLIAAIGVEDIVIAETDDAILVCPRNRVQDVRNLVEQMKNSRYKHYL